MTDLELARPAGETHLFVLPTFGRVTLPRIRGEVLIEAPELPDWRASGGRSGLHTFWRAEEAGRGTVATLSVDDRRIVCGDRQLDFSSRPATFLKGPGPWVVSERDRPIVSFARRYWGRKPVAVTVIDEDAARSDPRLTLFAAFSAATLSRGGAMGMPM
jgi:hypothetical protein